METEYTLVTNTELKRSAKINLPNVSKGEAFKGLSQKKITFDYALPQFWLDNFVRTTGLQYDLVASTTVWVYRDHREGPVSCCIEVQEKLEELYYK